MLTFKQLLTVLANTTLLCAVFCGDCGDSSHGVEKTKRSDESAVVNFDAPPH